MRLHTQLIILITIIIIIILLPDQNLSFNSKDYLKKNNFSTIETNQVNITGSGKNFPMDFFIKTDNIQIGFAQNTIYGGGKLNLNSTTFWTPINGKNKMENNGYLDNLVSRWSQKEYSNFIYTIKQKTIEGSGQTLILFRAQDINNYYSVNIAAYYNDWFRLEKKVDGETNTLIQKLIAGNSVFPTGTKWDITITADGDLIRVTISTIGNDKIKYKYSIEAHDSSFASGKVGISSTGYQYSHFSDIKLTDLTSHNINVTISYRITSNGLSNLTFNSYLTEKVQNPSGSLSYSPIYNITSINYNIKGNAQDINSSHIFSFPSSLIRPPDLIYFPTEPYQNRTFAIRLIARGWDEQKQEWVFAEAISPEFTWEDVVEGRTIMADGSRQ